MYLRLKKLFLWFQGKFFFYQILRSVTLLLIAIMKQMICATKYTLPLQGNTPLGLEKY